MPLTDQASNVTAQTSSTLVTIYLNILEIKDKDTAIAKIPDAFAYSFPRSRDSNVSSINGIIRVGEIRIDASDIGTTMIPSTDYYRYAIKIEVQGGAEATNLPVNTLSKLRGYIVVHPKVINRDFSDSADNEEILKRIQEYQTDTGNFDIPNDKNDRDIFEIGQTVDAADFLTQAIAEQYATSEDKPYITTTSNGVKTEDGETHIVSDGKDVFSMTKITCDTNYRKRDYGSMTWEDVAADLKTFDTKLVNGIVPNIIKPFSSFGRSIGDIGKISLLSILQVVALTPSLDDIGSVEKDVFEDL